MREIAEALEAITQYKPLILCLEDLHWCNQSTTEMLSFLARRRNPTRLLILATLRPADTIVNNLPLRDVKQDLQLHGLCTHLPLEFLSTTDIAGYLTANFSRTSFPKTLPPSFISKPTAIRCLSSMCWRICARPAC